MGKGQTDTAVQFGGPQQIQIHHTMTEITIRSNALTRKLFVLSIFIFALLTAPSTAQDQAAIDDVVALVMTVPEIANGLAGLPFYDTLAYNSRNTYGIWQVEFEDGDGETVAWAQVQPATGKIFIWETYFAANDAQYDAILPAYRDFVANHPDVRALIRGIKKDDISPWWDSNAAAWISWIGDAGDAIMVAVQFDGGAQDSTENPVLTKLWFPNLPSFDEWRVASSSEAIAIAFQNVDIAAGLRGKSWTTETEQIEGSADVWAVQFMADGETAVTAEVDVVRRELLTYEVSD